MEMGKKKKNKVTDYHSTSDEETLKNEECSHKDSAFNFQGVKKGLKNASNPLGTCQQCHSAVKKGTSEEDAGDSPFEPTVWICLQCGHQGCDRNSQEKHALTHYETPRSGSHALALSFATWQVWCYKCDDEVPSSDWKKFVECSEWLKKQLGVCKSDRLGFTSKKKGEEKDDREEDKKQKSTPNPVKKNSASSKVKDMTIMMEVSPLMSMPSMQQGYINLNIGGTFFTTSQDTLTRYPGSTLHSMFNKDGISTVPKDDVGRYFIDRDGSVFSFILNFLRSGNLNLPTDFTAHEQLIDEADYFQLPDMKKLIITRMESEEKQSITLASSYCCHVTSVFKTEDQYFHFAGGDIENKKWRAAEGILRKKAKKSAEQIGYRRRVVYTLQCSPTTFQSVIDFYNGKKSFIPRSKDELEELIAFAEFYELPELRSCLDTKLRIMKELE